MRNNKELLTFISHDNKVHVKLILKAHKHFVIIISDEYRKVKNRTLHNSLDKDSSIQEFHKIVGLLTNKI